MRQIKELIQSCLGIVIAILLLIAVALIAIKGCENVSSSVSTSPAHQIELPIQYREPKSYQVCPSCKGKGKVTYEIMKELGIDDGVRVCPRCSGSGHIYE